MLEIISTGRSANTRRRQIFSAMRRNAQLFNVSHESTDLSTEYDSIVTDNGDLSLKMIAGLRNSIPISRKFTAANSETLTHVDNESLSLAGSSKWMLSCWFLADSLISSNSIAGQYSFSDNNRSWRLEINALFEPTLRVSTDGTTVTSISWTSSIEIGEWNFVTTWYDENEGKIYIQMNNGIPVSTIYEEGVFSTSSDFSIGSVINTSNPANEWDGRISRLSIWKNSYPSSNQRTKLYNNGIGLWYKDLSEDLKSNLVSFWELNERSGSAYDRHGSNHLTDINTVTSVRGAIAPELVTNGRFDNWTGDDPDGWTVTGESSGDPEVSEVGNGESHGGAGNGACNIYTSSGLSVGINQTIITEIGKFYQISLDIDTLNNGGIIVRDDSGGVEDFEETYNKNAGTKKIMFQASRTSTVLRILRNQVGFANDVTIDNVSVKEITGVTYGMQCYLDDTAVIYGQKNISPPSSGSLRARFYMDTSQLVMASGNEFGIFDIQTSGGPATTILTVLLRYNGNSYQLKVSRRDDFDAYSESSAVNINNSDDYIEVLIRQASTNSSSDGSIQMWQGGSLIAVLSGIDNFDLWSFISSCRIGVIGGLDTGTNGEFFVDELVVRDDDRLIGA